MNDEHFTQSVYNNVLISAWTASDSKASYEAHCEPLMDNITHDSDAMLNPFGNDYIDGLKCIKIWNLSDGKFMGLSGHRYVKYGPDRNNLWSSIETISTARAFDSEKKELIFAVSISRYKEWER
jgi:hypothetical protein|tara:strand:+ start:876 stop:1247 length:372 start_codon:yes stop_codon:yes gene_type:complete